MLRQLRRKFASSISIIQGEEDFLYKTWLRIPLHKTISIGAIASRLLETPYITYEIEKPFFSKHFFELSESTVLPENLKYLFGKIGTNPVFFQLLFVPSKIIYHPEHQTTPKGGSSQNVDFILSKPDDRDITIQFKQRKPDGYFFIIPSPEIKDYLENLKPKVLKYDMLNQHELSNVSEIKNIHDILIENPDKLTSKKFAVHALQKPPKMYKVKVPGMGSYKSKVTSINLKYMLNPKISKSVNLNFKQASVTKSNFEYSLSLELKGAKTYPADISYDPGSMINELADDGKGNSVLKLLLKNRYKVKWDERKESKIELTKFENEGARYLAENDRALLLEEVGLHIIKESLAALKFLFLNKIIYSSLIVLPARSLGCANKLDYLDTEIGWIGSLEKYCPELSYSVIEGNDDERSDFWNKSALVHLIDQETLIKDYTLNIVDKKLLAKFNCIIIDEVQNLLEKSVPSASFLQEINPHIFWALSSFTYDDLQIQLNKILDESCRIQSSKIRRLVDLTEDNYGIAYKEFWLQPDEQQKTEYKETIVNCRKELKRVLESGNPYRYQSNIFILLHKIFQVENFAHGYDTSPKSELLLQHLKAIKSNKHKVIITSQYNRQGTKKIERLLDHANISYVSAPSSYSNDEIKKAISLFKSKKTITVFLTNAKLVQLNFEDLPVPYIIRFDSWWNPASVWQIKDLFHCGEDGNVKQRVNVFSYKMLDTIDEKIKNIMVSKDLIEDSIINVMNTNAINELISIDEWLRIFEMPVEEDQDKGKKLLDETIQTLNDLSLTDYRATLSRFFHSIGYTNVDILEHENSASFDIIGKGKAGKQEIELFCTVLLEDMVTKKSIKQALLNSSLIQKRNTFIITRGKFEKGSEALISNNVILMDIKKLANYLVILNLAQSQNEPLEQRTNSFKINTG